MNDLIFCVDTEPNLWGIINTDIPPDLLYYAYVPIIIISLLLGTFVLIKDKKSLQSKLLFLLTATFSLFIVNEIVQWVAVPAGIIHFAWGLSILLRLFIFVFTIYFVYTFVEGRDLPFKLKLLLVVLSSPIVLLLPTEMTVRSMDIIYCEGIDGVLASYQYVYESLVATIFFLWGSAYLFRYYFAKKTDYTLQKIYLLFGAAFFLFIFFISQFLVLFTGEYEINLVGPIGMLGFLMVLYYMIVKFRLFNVKLLAAQAIVLALVALVGSQLFFAEETANQILIAVNLIIAIIGGILLIRSVKREVEQRKELEVLTQKLAVANERLKELDKLKSEFVSIASHQLRSPLTAIRGYASLILDGSYGKVPKKAVEALDRISESAKNMAYSIEDYLNVSRIESGNMKYNNADFNIRDEAEHVADDLRPQAIKKGLGLIFRTDMKSTGVVNADVGKVIQIIQNLINNAIKYTPEGSIRILVRDDVPHKKIYIDIEDTGVGIPKESIHNLFGKFERASNANAANIHGTGLGLFVAHQMATQMGGDITVQSEGEGKGSRFTIEFPLAM